MKSTILLLVLSVAAAGCVQQGYEPLTEINVDACGPEVYVFANDIRAVLKVPVNDAEGIKQIAEENDVVALVFDGSNTQDNGYFTVVVTDFQQKIPVCYSYGGRLFQLIPFYYEGGQWYDRNGKNITKPDFTIPVIWLRGPSTGANETSLDLANNTIYLSGTSYRNLTMAGDRLSLLFFNIDELKDIEGA